MTTSRCLPQSGNIHSPRIYRTSNHNKDNSCATTNIDIMCPFCDQYLIDIKDSFTVIKSTSLSLTGSKNGGAEGADELWICGQRGYFDLEKAF